MSCQCCGHAVNSHQQGGLCSRCEDLLNGIRSLPPKTRQHVLVRGCGASAAEVMQLLGCGYSTNSSALNSAYKSIGCTQERMLAVAAYGLAHKRLPVPDGLERPTYETPVHEPPKPKLLERVVIDTPAPRPVVVEHRERVRMLTDREEDAPLTRAVAEFNNAEEEGYVEEHVETEGMKVVAEDAITSLLEAARKEAHDAGMDYQVAFAELAHLVLTGDQLPDMNLVRLAYRLGEAKGQVLALESLA